MRETYRGKGSELAVLKPLLQTKKLFIEDIGTTVTVGKVESDFSLRIFLSILDSRLEHCRATFISTNKTLEELRNSFDERVASRIVQACEIIRLSGEDRRYGPAKPEGRLL